MKFSHIGLVFLAGNAIATHLGHTYVVTEIEEEGCLDNHQASQASQHDHHVLDGHNIHVQTTTIRVGNGDGEDVSPYDYQDPFHSTGIRTHSAIRCAGNGEIDNECRQWCSCTKKGKKGVMRCQDPADVSICKSICTC